MGEKTVNEAGNDGGSMTVVVPMEIIPMKIFLAEVQAYGGEIMVIRASDLEAATRIAKTQEERFELKIEEVPLEGSEGLIRTRYTG